MNSSAKGRSHLYDKVHAAMVNWLVEQIRSKADAEGYDPSYQVYPEFAYNYYGHRGSVDIVAYHSGWTKDAKKAQGVIEVYEVWSAVYRLEEALRKFNEKAEFIPKYFQMTRKPKDKIGLQRNFFVLLNSLQNVTMIKDHWHIFVAQFFEFHKIINVLDWGVANQLVLIDPINPLYPVYRGFGPEGSDTVITSLPWIVVNFPAPGLEDRLQHWSYLDARDFWEKYQAQR